MSEGGDNVLMTLDEATVYLKLSRSTLARMVRAHQIPVVRLDRRRVLFRKETLDELVKQAEWPARELVAP